MKIKDLIGEMAEIISVIDGSGANLEADEIINNIMHIIVTDEIKKNFIEVLDKYDKFFDPNQGT